MTRLVVLASVVLLAACTGPDPTDDPAGFADTRQKPSNTTPGVHISGHVNVGVVRSF